jgi:hypothetical protein
MPAEVQLEGSDESLHLHVDRIGPEEPPIAIVVQMRLPSTRDRTNAIVEIPVGKRRLLYEIFPSLEASP